MDDVLPTFDEPSFPQWQVLFDDVKLRIIPMLDYETRRALLMCSDGDKALVEKFTFRSQMDVTVEFSATSGKWHCSYANRQDLLDAPDFSDCYTEQFDTREEAYQHMKKMIKNTEVVGRLTLELEVNSKIRLRDDNKLANVFEITLKFVGGYENVRNDAFEFLFWNVNPSFLTAFDMELKDLRKDQYCLTDKFYEFEKTFDLCEFCLYGAISDNQMLSLRTNQIDVTHCQDVTPFGFVTFIQKLIHYSKRDSTMLYCRLERCSSEMQMFLFGRLYDTRREQHTELFFNMIGTDLVLSICFFLQDDNADSDEARNFDISLNQRPCVIGPRCFYEENSKALNNWPTLRNFLFEVSRGLPQGFPMMAG